MCYVNDNNTPLFGIGCCAMLRVGDVIFGKEGDAIVCDVNFGEFVGNEPATRLFISVATVPCFPWGYYDFVYSGLGSPPLRLQVNSAER